MSNAISQVQSKDCRYNQLDDSLLVKAYNDSVTLARDELARRLSFSTNQRKVNPIIVTKSNSPTVNFVRGSQVAHKIGDYVRATYDDGVDYEAKIISINDESATCILKYIGYENIQEVPMCNLITSWGKKSRRLQFAKAKAETGADIGNVEKTTNHEKKLKSIFGMSSVPPPPPIPPSIATQIPEDSEHLSAMLMSWYMSGYYTGIYQGMQIVKSEKKKK